METAKKDKNTKLFLHLKKWLEKAVLDYNMIDEEDKLLIGVSGGADSMALLDLLDSPMLYIPHFSFVTVNIDLGFDPAYRAYNELEKYFQENGYRYVMEKRRSVLYLIPISIKKSVFFMLAVTTEKYFRNCRS